MPEKSTSLLIPNTTKALLAQPQKSRRILYVITKSVWGGAAKYVFDLAVNLPKDQYTVAVAAGGQNELADKIKQANLSYYKIKSFQKKVNLIKDIFAIWEVFQLLKNIKPDIIHVNSSKAGGIVGISSWFYKIATRQKPKLIFTAHGWAFAEDRSKWQLFLIKLFSKITAIFYNKIICVSDFDCQIALANKITRPDKLITIHNGLDINNLSFMSRQKAQIKLMGKTADFTIGTIAEWTKNKGLIYLLEALAKIKPADKLNVILIGSGENPDKEIIYQLINNHPIKNIYLFDFLPQAASYLKAFDIFVLPSLKEGLPYTILEAASAQVPIIASRAGGIPEIIENKISGLLVESKNSLELAVKMIDLLNFQKNAQKLGLQAQKIIKQKFNFHQMLEKTEKLYQ